MITVLFFAQVRELVGIDTLTVSADCQTVDTLRQALCERGERWALALEPGRLLAAVNQSLVAMNHQLHTGDEVAFFPPVTGG